MESSLSEHLENERDREGSHNRAASPGEHSEIPLFFTSSGGTCEAGQTLVEVLHAIKQAKVAGEDLSVFLHLLDSLLPPALLQEAVNCMERGAVTAYCCSTSTAAFHLVHSTREKSSKRRATNSSGNDALPGHIIPPSGSVLSTENEPCPPGGYMVLPRFCSCKTFQCGVLTQESDLTCVHEIVVQLAEAMDCVGRRVVLGPEEFSQRLLEACGETAQLQLLYSSQDLC
ncbi:hypothetical protein BESB_069060 [Besnoitia besnoiti]|uniref:SWIM-type domain-containing protein n=1 Tax=Besnoitia besnoiti TaxID=94643 RepID=A0A2A9MGU1_BESBE|nr:hypothetical protein BESB_069060 [Besnoitia besnoiti]PFH34873.1 hypothetical protein BESB_069060 [Besnoitia besnoiti]